MMQSTDALIYMYMYMMQWSLLHVLCRGFSRVIHTINKACGGAEGKPQEQIAVTCHALVNSETFTQNMNIFATTYRVKHNIYMT